MFQLGDETKSTKLSRTGSSSRRSDVAEDLSETSTNNEEDNVFEELFNTVSCITYLCPVSDVLTEI